MPPRIIAASKNGLKISASVLLASFLHLAVLSGLAFADDLLSDPDRMIQQQESSNTEAIPKWTRRIEEGPDQIFFLAEAVSGKKLKNETFDLLRGVTEVVIEKQEIIFKRIDKEELKISSDTESGGKFFDDWEKSKTNLEDKFGRQGKEFLENIKSVHVSGDRIQVERNGPEELVVELGSKKLHPAFDLRGLRFKQISMLVDHSGDYPCLKDIQGVSAIIKAPGLSFPVEVKEFWKRRLKKDNEIKVAVKNPVPAAVRVFLFMPAILRFHFSLPRKE